MPKDLSKFGTAEFPLHPSGLRALIVCPWRIVMEFLAMPEGDDSSGPAADTGSAMHKAAAAFHRGKGVADSVEVMRANVQEYPLANLAEAAQMFLSYAADERNSGFDVPICEERVDFSIAAAEDDPTGERIEVMATCDQVRHIHGRYKAWDIKTSKRDPSEVLAETWFQMAGYCIGASVALSARLGKPIVVEPGGIITPRRYHSNPSTSPVFWHHNFKFDWIEQLLRPVRHHVSQIRRGHIWHVPNADCKWCHQGNPDVCFPKLITTLELLKPAGL